MALSSRLWSGARKGKDHTQQGKVPAVRAYFIPVRGIMVHLGYIISLLNPPNVLKPGLSREHPNAGPAPKSSWQLLVHLLLMIGISSSFMIVFSIKEQQEPNFCLPHPHPSQSHALIPEERGDPQGSSHPQSMGDLQCLSFLPSLPAAAHSKRPQWTQQEVCSQACKPSHLPHFHLNLSSGMHLHWSHKRGDQANTTEQETAHPKPELRLMQHPRLFLSVKRDNQHSGRLKRLSRMMTAPISGRKAEGEGIWFQTKPLRQAPINTHPRSHVGGSFFKIIGVLGALFTSRKAF